jgi:recombinational DNA repair ATPase RecF
MIKLIELYIQEFRGIRNLTLQPQCENFVIHGPNGSGKSGVVDAIDFGLTGGYQLKPKQADAARDWAEVTEQTVVVWVNP